MKSNTNLSILHLLQLLFYIITIVSGFHLPCFHLPPSKATRRQTLPTCQTSLTSPIPRTTLASTELSTSEHILFDLPVSNNGARCRIILYKKGIRKDQVEILSPAEVGGLKSSDYLNLNPAGLMPSLTIQKADNPYGINAIAESDTIARYLISEYSDAPSFLPDHPKSNQIARWHDMYLTPIQGCLYKPSSRLPFGNYADRKSAIAAYRKNLEVIEGFVGDLTGLYLCGDDISLADATLFPSLVFATFMLPKFDHAQPALPLTLTQYYNNLMAKDEVFSKVHDEIMSVLVDSWDAKNRWDDIWLAGQRDTAPGTIFDKILSGEIPASVVKEDDHILAFKDINPMAPAHIVIIPKDRSGLTNLRKASAEHIDILGRLLVTAGEIAKDAELGFGDGARIVINDGNDGGQEVMHLHVHVLGGKKLDNKLG